ncbi:hypothetical protein SB6411_00255 [Klebsiella spallanzanii]|uniref:Uncharacterized protein n=1 Tax=Klebsiella spallanzanii TaxID=2587528 RepID=A0ABY6V4E6_9ENTR|nr:hypothetical protein [Klebsiella spallanzanii]VUS22876.1 hypothetical protein SB6411_00255 [Klebsiella spallanzanii]
MTHQKMNNFREPENLETILTLGADVYKVSHRGNLATYHPLTTSINGVDTRFSSNNGEKMSEKSITTTQFWVGIILAILTVLGTGVCATWTISNSMNDKTNGLRKDMSDEIKSSRIELSAKIDRVEDKTAEGFKDTSSQLNDIKILLAKSEQKEVNK